MIDRSIKVAVLFFGLPNTFPMIYGPEGDRPNIVASLRSLGIDPDIYFDGSEISFFKVPAETEIEGGKIYGQEVIDRYPASENSDRDYLVTRVESHSLQKSYQSAFPDLQVKGYVELPDKTTWSGGQRLSRMIYTFLFRKLRLAQRAVAESYLRGFEYDFLVLVRPDSVLRIRHGCELPNDTVSTAVQRSIERMIHSGALGVDFGAFSKELTEEPIFIAKNDLLIGSPRQILRVARMVEKLHPLDSFQNIYTDPVFRCRSCNRLQTESTKLCEGCGSTEGWVDLTSWPEKKTASHIRALELPYDCLDVTGGVLR